MYFQHFLVAFGLLTAAFAQPLAIVGAKDISLKRAAGDTDDFTNTPDGTYRAIVQQQNGNGLYDDDETVSVFNSLLANIRDQLGEGADGASGLIETDVGDDVSVQLQMSGARTLDEISDDDWASITSQLATFTSDTEMSPSSMLILLRDTTDPNNIVDVCTFLVQYIASG